MPWGWQHPSPRTYSCSWWLILGAASCHPSGLEPEAGSACSCWHEEGDPGPFSFSSLPKCGQEGPPHHTDTVTGLLTSGTPRLALPGLLEPLMGRVWLALRGIWSSLLLSQMGKLRPRGKVACHRSSASHRQSQDHWGLRPTECSPHVGAALSASYILTHLIFNSSRRYCSHSHFTDEETEAHGRSVTWLRSANNGQKLKPETRQLAATAHTTNQPTRWDYLQWSAVLTWAF